MADAPLISVLMPVRNGRRYVAEAIDSVLNQTLGDFELLILDDGSTDQTPAILKTYAARDARIHIQTGAFGGISAALNQGLAGARGRYIARMDGDDICDPQRFETQVRYLEEHRDCVLVGGQCMFIDDRGLDICLKPDVVLKNEEISAALLKGSWPLVHPAVMMRADALRKIGGYDPRYRTNQDHDLFLRLAEVGELANLPQVVLKYRQHFQSVGAKKSAAHANVVVDIIREAHRRRGIAFEEPTDERPRILTPMDHHTNWWWWSLQAGHRKTARRHAWAMVRGAPLSRGSWRALYCALRGR